MLVAIEDIEKTKIRIRDHAVQVAKRPSYIPKTNGSSAGGYAGVHLCIHG